VPAGTMSAAAGREGLSEVAGSWVLRGARAERALSGVPCWDSKIVPLSYSHNTGVKGPEEFKLIVQHSS